VLQRDPRGVGVLIVQHRVPMEEGPPPAILPGEAHAEAVLDQRRVGEALSAPQSSGCAPCSIFLRLAIS